MYVYDAEFYRYINRGALQSAGKLLPALLAILPEPIDSVLDVGCGAGAWLSVWKTHGAEVVGLDGDYVNKEALLIEQTEFFDADLCQGFDLKRRFSLVQSLEVAEHLPESAAAGFVESLCRHSDIVMFSAAPPGQGGENHVNEQSYDYWRKLFHEQCYELYDPIRPAVLSDSDVKPWYRFNTFLYVGKNCTPELRETLSTYRVADTEPVRDVSPRIYQIRKKFIQVLPPMLKTYLAIAKKYLSLSVAKFNGGRG